MSSSHVLTIDPRDLLLKTLRRGNEYASQIEMMKRACIQSIGFAKHLGGQRNEKINITNISSLNIIVLTEKVLTGSSS